MALTQTDRKQIINERLFVLVSLHVFIYRQTEEAATACEITTYPLNSHASLCLITVSIYLYKKKKRGS